MRVADLITELEKLPQHAEVVLCKDAYGLGDYELLMEVTFGLFINGIHYPIDDIGDTLKYFEENAEPGPDFTDAEEMVCLYPIR